MKNSIAANEKIREAIEFERERERKLHYRFARRFGYLSGIELPKYLRAIDKKSGCRYYLEVWTEDGVKKSRYLGKEDNPVVQQVQERKFLEAALEELDERAAAYETNRVLIDRFEPEAVNASLPKAYKLSDERLAAIAGRNEEDEWYAEALKEKERNERTLSDYFKDGRKQRAKDGTRMRSKSETVIANELIDKGIKYIYEFPVKVSGVPIHPDFAFYSYSRRKVMLWEHAGMLGDEGYRQDFVERVDLYTNGGYAPGVDVIFTFDTTYGMIDSEIVDKVIDEYI